MEVAQYITVAASPLHNPSGKTLRAQDARIALPPDSSFFENARQGTLKKPHSLPTQGASGLEPFDSKPGRCRCGSMTRPLFRRSLPIQGPVGCHTEPRDEPRLPCRGHRRRRMPVSINVFTFYSSAAPRAELLNHLVIYQAPRNHPGSSAPSRIRNSLRLKNQRSTRTPSAIGHVARRCYPPGHPRMSQPFRPGIVSAPPNRSRRAGKGSAISAARREKRPLTLQG